MQNYKYWIFLIILFIVGLSAEIINNEKVINAKIYGENSNYIQGDYLQGCQTYTLTEDQIAEIMAVVAGEGNSTYDAALAVVSTMFNRADTGNTDPYHAAIAPNQYVARTSEGVGNIPYMDVYKAYDASHSLDSIKSIYLNVYNAVMDALSGRRNTTAKSFRTTTSTPRPGAIDIGGNSFYNFADIVCDGTTIHNVIISEGGNNVEKKHYSTSYGGDLNEGWLYLRTRALEDARNTLYHSADDMDDAIDEIFYRAHLSYVASNKEYCSKNNINAEDGGSINYGQGAGGSLPDYALDAFGCPVGGAGTCTITSGYGGRGDGHLAVDVAKSGNPPILAAADGTVTGVKVDNNNYYRGWDTVNNKPICDSHSANTIQITHEINGEKWITTYVHLDSIMVSNGQQVTKGEQIGTMGNTGCSSGDHLHFAITGPDNKNYNPTPIISKCS